MPPAATSRLQPHAPVAERVLLPGDPGRALRLAQWLLEAPKMLNHHRGLWGYSGTATADGRPLTIQSTGTGGPSATLVVEDLAALGAGRMIRVGTSLRLDAALRLGELVVADPVLSRDGTSRALGAPERQVPDRGLTLALGRADGARSGAVLCVDVLAGLAPDGALVADRESGAVLATAARHGLPAAAIVAVTESGDGERIGPEALEAAEQALGRAALAALA